MSAKTMRPPKLNDREEDFKRPKKQPTSTTIPMTESLKSDKPRAGSEAMNYSKKGSKPRSSNKGSSSNPVNNNNKNKGSSSKPVNNNSKGSSSKLNNQLLAGYLAHEYLTKGTLLGKMWDQLPSQRVELKQEEKHQKYVELAHLLKTDGAYMSGFVNPAQLARSLRLL